MAHGRTGNRERLQEAALVLYAERGFARTTVAEVAARAGLAERTYFRYFPDKQEVLFADDDALLAILLDAVRSAPGETAGGKLASIALRAVARELEPRRAELRLRAEVLAVNPDLFNRDVTKHANLVRVLEQAIQAHGVSHIEAALAAAVAGAIFRVAYGNWLIDHGELDLTTRLNEAIDRMPTIESLV